jgi:hypothetical protein
MLYIRQTVEKTWGKLFIDFKKVCKKKSIAKHTNSIHVTGHVNANVFKPNLW